MGVLSANRVADGAAVLPAGAATGAPPTSAAGIPAAANTSSAAVPPKVLAESASLSADKQLPKEMEKLFNEVGRDFERRMVRYLNTNQLAKSLLKKCEIYKDNNPEHGWQYPNGTRAWHAPLEVESMDAVWSKVENDEYTCQITIAKGTSRRDAMQAIHYHCHGFLTDLHHEVVANHAGELRSMVSKEEFIKACGEYKATGENGTADGLDDPIRKPLDSQMARTHVELLYGKIVDKARAARDKRTKELEEKELADKKRLEEAARLPPQKTLVALIDERIQAKSGEMDTGEGEDVDHDAHALQAAEEFVSAVGANTLPKQGNGGAQKAGSGSATKNQPKAQSTGKGKGGGKQSQPAAVKKQTNQPSAAGAGGNSGPTRGRKKSRKFKNMLWGANNDYSQSKSKGKGKGQNKGKGKGKGGKSGKGPSKSKGKGKGHW